MLIMEYNSRKIGARIKAERKKKGWNQQFLADKLGMTRQTLSKIESGMYDGSSMSIYTLSDLAGLFDCDIGYLLGEYDEKTRPHTDVMKETGLNEECIDALNKMDDATKVIIQGLITNYTCLDKLKEQFVKLMKYDCDIDCCSPVWNDSKYIDDLRKLDMFGFPSKEYCESAMFFIQKYAEEVVYSIFMNPVVFNTLSCEFDKARTISAIKYLEAKLPRLREGYFVRRIIHFLSNCMNDYEKWNYWHTLQNIINNDNPLKKYMPDDDIYYTADERPYFRY